MLPSAFVPNCNVGRSALVAGIYKASGSPFGHNANPSLFMFRGGGGAAAAAAIDMAREGHNLTTMASYGIMTALIMDAALWIYTATTFKSNGKRFDSVLPCVFYFLEGLCLVSGVYTAVSFQLLGIYSRTAIGMGNMEGYVAFRAATAIHRKWGFRCFLTSLFSFMGCFMASFYNRMSEYGRAGKSIFAVAACLAIAGSCEIFSILQLSSKIVFR